MRLSVILVVGVVLTAIALVVSRQLNPVASPATVASPPPRVSYNDPPWTVPLPTRTPAPSSAPPRKVAPKPKATNKTTPRTVRTTPQPQRTAASTAPVVRQAPTMLGPPADSSVEAVLTTHCVRTRGALAVATLAENGTWSCRYAGQTKPLDLTAACRWFYGTGARPQRLDKNNPYSWRCFR